MMYCFKFPNDIDKLLDGRTIIFAGKEMGIGRERMSKILRAEELCNTTEYTESEAKAFYAKRNIRINKRRIN